MRLDFIATVMGKYAAEFDTCDACGFLQVRQPYWLPEAYSSGIATTDTGIVERNSIIARILTSTLYFVMGERGNGRYLDVAGGYGLLVRMMRDYGFDFYWSDKYCENLLARGFDAGEDLGVCQAVTAFEVMEHLEDPIHFVSEALSHAKTDTFIFSTLLFDGKPPRPADWWFYSLETGQHIAFFQHRTLLTLANRLNMRYYSIGNIYIFTRKILSSSMLKLCAGKCSYFLDKIAKKRLGSRVMADHFKMGRSIS